MQAPGFITTDNGVYHRREIASCDHLGLKGEDGGAVTGRLLVSGLLQCNSLAFGPCSGLWDLSFGKTLLHRKQGIQTNTTSNVTAAARIKTPMNAAAVSDHTNR